MEVEGADVEECSLRLKGGGRLRGRAAEAGGILGFNTLPPPTFWRTQKKWKLERVGYKKLGGMEIFRRWKKF